MRIFPQTNRNQVSNKCVFYLRLTKIKLFFQGAQLYLYLLWYNTIKWPPSAVPIRTDYRWQYPAQMLLIWHKLVKLKKRLTGRCFVLSFYMTYLSTVTVKKTLSLLSPSSSLLRSCSLGGLMPHTAVDLPTILTMVVSRWL